MHNYHLMQQGRIKATKMWDSEKTILMNINLSYMGSSEFEWGALPEAMARLLSARDEMIFGKIEVTLPVGSHRSDLDITTVLVRYWVKKDQEKDLVEMLSNWRQYHRGFKEWDVELTNTGDIVFCIDQDHECFMWNGKLGKRLIEEHLDSTLAILTENGWIEDTCM